MSGEMLRDPGTCRTQMTTPNDSSEAFANPEGGYESRRRLVLDELSHLDELTPDDEEEISRFRSYASAPAAGRSGRLGRFLGHRVPAPGRVAS